METVDPDSVACRDMHIRFCGDRTTLVTGAEEPELTTRMKVASDKLEARGRGQLWYQAP